MRSLAGFHPAAHTRPPGSAAIGAGPSGASAIRAQAARPPTPVLDLCADSGDRREAARRAGEDPGRRMGGDGMRFTGTTVIITGAAGGLGSAMAAAFAAEGGRVAVVDLPGSQGARIADQINQAGAAGSTAGAAGSAFFVPCDLADL